MQFRCGVVVALALAAVLSGCSADAPSNTSVTVDLGGAHGGSDYSIASTATIVSSAEYAESWVDVSVTNLGDAGTRSPVMVAHVVVGNRLIRCGNERGHLYYGGHAHEMAESLLCESYIEPEELAAATVNLQGTRSWSGETWVNPAM